ncbi:MAG TPA: Spx/MgsR family RNA polymerase-binding regulatory protein [bacterium]
MNHAGPAGKRAGTRAAVTVYGYATCGTCRNAQRWLRERGMPFRDVDITRTPPSRTVLAAAVRSGGYRACDLLNRSGELYRAMRMKEKAPAMSERALLALLARHGRLIKRPVITDGRRVTVGFDPDRLRAVWTA